jgi:hypothetical protein
MSGVTLVGYSGSLIHDAVKDALSPPVLRSLTSVHTKEEDEDLSKVLVGAHHLPRVLRVQTIA